MPDCKARLVVFPYILFAWARYLGVRDCSECFTEKSNSFNIQSEFTIMQQEFLHSDRLDFRLESGFEAILE